MLKLSTILAGLSAAALVASSPAIAQTRSADSLPVSSAAVGPGTSGGVASQLQDDDDDDGIAGLFGGSPLLLLVLLGAIGGVILIASGGGNGNDSPG